MRTSEIEARLVVGADGRGSMVRREAGFAVKNDPPKLFFSGILFENVGAEPDHVVHVFAPGHGVVSYTFPQRDGRARVYFGYHKDTGLARLQGAGDLERFRASCGAMGVPLSVLRNARPAGPLATFEGADNWVDERRLAGAWRSRKPNEKRCVRVEQSFFHLKTLGGDEPWQTSA